MVTKGKELEYDSTLIFINNIDLSRNSLMGEILDELTGLVGLGTLNLSMNHLTGNVLKNIGNLRWLETLDLSKNRDGTSALTIIGGSVEDEQNGDDYEKLWLYASIGLGFVVGFWGVCGTLLLKKSWRHGYFICRMISKIELH
ncbi:receptor-like protein eix2 [Quercus suber]|uniref:Receptor-like protein eix2 n=1 Tax=Quercus suber TaxID=58331 RepID=A0AAW0IH64_QUESU